ncbi:MAG: phosphoribosylformimino-5-aminoimidazole carboxamide ribotide isomerase [Blautia sp.]|nr:phosphoribosylformimino-5-aminoimidazole carboxamide ribotide isomerase [Blautia sp.]
MRFRPCIDIHDGKVKQIVGGSLLDGSGAEENYVSTQDGAYFARLYQEKGLRGGHVILLNAPSSPLFAETKRQALLALSAYPGGLQLGGGVNPDNAATYLEAGASHVICTSYCFCEGEIQWDRLEKMVKTVGRERLVLDLSCRLREGKYFIVTDRWQKFTHEPLSLELLTKLGAYCDEFLVHAVDKEGKRRGADLVLAGLLASYGDRKITYAGGIGSLSVIEELKAATQGKLDVTVGSALDLFGGVIPFEEMLHLEEGK